MRNGLAGAFLAGTALLLAGCGDKEEGGAAATLEKGQVLATVDGEEITIHELNAELTGVALPPEGPQRKQIEQAALQQIVNRRILANIARERGLDKSPQYLLQERRADQALLVQMLQRDLASKVRRPTRDEAEKFMRENPALFAERKIYEIDQIQFAQPQDVQQLRKFEPLNTMEEVEGRLIEDGTEYRRAPTTLDTVGANPALIEQMNKLPAGEIFLIPTGRVVLANQIKQTKVEPFAGDRAIDYAMTMIQQRALGEAAKTDLDGKLKAARDKVQYQAGYAPPAAPKAPANKAPAAAPKTS